MNSLNEVHDEAWWNQHYTTLGQASKAEPSEFLRQNLSSLRSGQVLDLAMGAGHNAIFLSKQGFEVHGVDFSQVALDQAMELAQSQGQSLGVKKQNLEFFLIEVMSMDNIIVMNYLPALTLMKNLVRGLKPGGILLLEGYTKAQSQISERGYPQFDECFATNQALSHCAELELIFYQERELEHQQHRVQLIGRKKTL
ncbi:MAG: class I SAM-dependent methyltransferase [Bdellovibrionales bacterium]|nr:class I SAM-dependent methyltransferase [Bdellovibrionales bacterium]